MSLVNYTVRDRVGFITLNRPEKRNALSFELVASLKDAFQKAESDPKVKVVILGGEGEAFCAGADLEYIKQLQGNSYAENLKDSNHLKELFLQIYKLKKVVIAKVHGHALAGGCGLATVCDFVFAVPEAKMGYTEVKIGFIPALVMVFLIRKIGEQRARHLLLSGELVSGDGALQAGLVTRLIPKEQLDAAVETFAQHLVQNNSGQSMETTKGMIAGVQSLPLEDALDLAASMNAHARETEDCRKGILAFLEKRKIEW